MVAPLFIFGAGEQAEMAEEQPTPVMGTQAEAEMAQAEQPTPTNDSQTAVSQELEEMRRALKKANAEAAKYRNQASAFEEAEQKRKESEMSELEKLQKKLAETEAAKAQLQRETLQRRVAAEMGLPETLALRLQGDDIDSMKADAELILASLPKPASPKVNPTNPANGQPPGETAAERRARIHSGGQKNTDALNPVVAAQHGGGVFWRDQEK